MKKALDFVSDYQLKSACKYAICIAPSKVIQMIFAVLEDWYHHIILTHSCKLVSFYIYRNKNSQLLLKIKFPTNCIFRIVNIWKTKKWCFYVT